VSVIADNPIRKLEDDVLGRAKVARSFAEQVISLDVSEGVVVGVLGPWGSGKTSFINLTRARLEGLAVAVLDFNPWMFSGAEQLVESFFVEVSAQLKLRSGLAEVGKDLEDYGETFSGMGWLPLVGPWIERGRAATNILAKILQHRKEGIGGRRAKIEQALAALDKPIVVVIDDIDRLTTSEIRDIFKLVRLTANFPNVIYIVAFDRVRVEEALAEQGIPGRDYLEKILQVGVDLPAVPAHVLNKQIFQAIDNALSTVDNKGPFDENVWPDVFMEVIRPLLRNMRDVRRYATAIHGTVRVTVHVVEVKSPCPTMLLVVRSTPYGRSPTLTARDLGVHAARRAGADCGASSRARPVAGGSGAVEGNGRGVGTAPRA
jgi:predicted KAP-like P-loop ATPase